ncbi:hypothetical protein ACHMW7_22990 [Aminobacter sp. UC22_36]|uniref:hypothetical protein n=1 Tax=Aminobacter sp. UC22_36 TaxID=3374549 RepID=UPI003757C5C4
MRVAGSIEQIVERGLCTGCGACASLLGNDVLGMDLSPEGFMRPRRRRPLKDVEQGAVMQVCTASRQTGPAHEDAEPHPIFGRFCIWPRATRSINKSASEAPPAAC